MVKELRRFEFRSVGCHAAESEGFGDFGCVVQISGLGVGFDKNAGLNLVAQGIRRLGAIWGMAGLFPIWNSRKAPSTDP